jgi:hypothetical protein
MKKPPQQQQRPGQPPRLLAFSSTKADHFAHLLGLDARFPFVLTKEMGSVTHCAVAASFSRINRRQSRGGISFGPFYSLFCLFCTTLYATHYNFPTSHFLLSLCPSVYASASACFVVFPFRSRGQRNELSEGERCPRQSTRKDADKVREQKNKRRDSCITLCAWRLFFDGFYRTYVILFCFVLFFTLFCAFQISWFWGLRSTTCIYFLPNHFSSDLPTTGLAWSNTNLLIVPCLCPTFSLLAISSPFRTSYIARYNFHYFLSKDCNCAITPHLLHLLSPSLCPSFHPSFPSYPLSLPPSQLSSFQRPQYQSILLHKRRVKTTREEVVYSPSPCARSNTIPSLPPPARSPTPSPPPSAPPSPSSLTPGRTTSPQSPNQAGAHGASSPTENTGCQSPPATTRTR